MKKEKSCLITQALVSSIDWRFTAPNTVIAPERGGNGVITWSEQAHIDLYNMLSRTPTPFPEPARQGVEFEKMVYKRANDTNLKGSESFQKVCKEVKGFSFYQKRGVNLEIAHENCYLYGKFDAIKLPVIKDIKTTASYKTGKYLNGFQHKLYCYITKAEKFAYIIVEWELFPKIKNVYKESFIVVDQKSLEKEVIETVEQCFQNLKSLNLWDVYREKYCLY